MMALIVSTRVECQAFAPIRLWLRNRMLGIIPLILPLLRRLNLRPDAGIQRAANALTLAALPSPLSASRVPAEG